MGRHGPRLSYDCSGLTQAAWKAAGVTLPRVTYDQVNAGTTVSVAQAQPGDLVFFYDDISHVGLYIGDGMMIHAPKPGAYVREESIFYDGESSIYGVVAGLIGEGTYALRSDPPGRPWRRALHRPPIPRGAARLVARRHRRPGPR
ncbi:hypothetical protein SVIOM342S_06915 [Streptomyces violaceorubidus]